MDEIEKQFQEETGIKHPPIADISSRSMLVYTEKFNKWLKSKIKNLGEPSEAQANRLTAVMCNYSGWINCADRLPEFRQRVLCYIPPKYIGNKFKNTHHIGIYNHTDEQGVWFNVASHSIDGLQCGMTDTVTHWKPLPDPPE